MRSPSLGRRAGESVAARVGVQVALKMSIAIAPIAAHDLRRRSSNRMAAPGIRGLCTGAANGADEKARSSQPYAEVTGVSPCGGTKSPGTRSTARLRHR
jgi:hypothetical protein